MMTDNFEAVGLEFEASLRCLWDGMVSIDRCIPTDYLCIPMFTVSTHDRTACQVNSHSRNLFMAIFKGISFHFNWACRSLSIFVSCRSKIKLITSMCERREVPVSSPVKQSSMNERNIIQSSILHTFSSISR